MTLVLEPLPDSELVLGGAKQTGDLVSGGLLLASCTSFFPRPRPDAAAASPRSTPHFSNYGCVCVCVSAALSLAARRNGTQAHIIDPLVHAIDVHCTQQHDWPDTAGLPGASTFGSSIGWIVPKPPPPPALSQERYPAIL